MHELSLAENLIQLVEQTARREAAARVRAVVVEIGELSAVEVDALRFAFDAVKRGGLAAQAQLELIPIPGRGRCQDCAAEVPMPVLYAACSACGSCRVDILSGRELRVRDILIEDAPA